MSVHIYGGGVSHLDIEVHREMEELAEELGRVTAARC